MHPISMEYLPNVEPEVDAFYLAWQICQKISDPGQQKFVLNLMSIHAKALKRQRDQMLERAIKAEAQIITSSSYRKPSSPTIFNTRKFSGPKFLKLRFFFKFERYKYPPPPPPEIAFVFHCSFHR